ncbi:LuxR C-terminal-related transcriptional regulator [Mucilaginibacter inviolabilis]|uniref:LuxR C-terminal-related transcriptional regulator n=1 Tax=Mucilaginibacter inviolabilis TaxID=2714892 RepID=UPI001F3B5324|nr:LuxR C-terminal-related transcriptional regulator [Mucilaginibacter inviolabilis]
MDIMLIPKKIYEFIPNLVVPKAFWGTYGNKLNCLYLTSCEQKEMLFISESLTELLGYSPRDIQEGGRDWWLSIIHPDDLEPMLNEVFRHYFLKPARQRLKKIFTLQYRVKNTFGDYRWMCETKLVASLTSENKYEFILGRVEDITEIKNEEEAQLKKLLEEERKTNQMLQHALPVIDMEQKSKPDHVYLTDNHIQPHGVVMPTKRELEILQLIGEGYSTKQIADQLFISINTVETHRRHLLKKLQVKNSMELIKRSTNAFWLKVAV